MLDMKTKVLYQKCRDEECSEYSKYVLAIPESDIEFTNTEESYAQMFTVLFNDVMTTTEGSQYIGYTYNGIFWTQNGPGDRIWNLRIANELYETLSQRIKSKMELSSNTKQLAKKLGKLAALQVCSQCVTTKFIVNLRFFNFYFYFCCE